METKELSSAFRILAKWCAVLSMIIVIYPEVFLIRRGEGIDEMMSETAKLMTHTHIACCTFLFFMVGYLFTYSSLDRAKKIWPTICAISLIIFALGSFLGLLPLLGIGGLIFVISILVMSIGIIGWV